MVIVKQIEILLEFKEEVMKKIRKNLKEVIGIIVNNNLKEDKEEEDIRV